MKKNQDYSDTSQFRIILQRDIVEIKKKNPRFSLRSYANKLKVSPGALSQVLNGKRKPTQRLVIGLYENLKKRDVITPEIAEYFNTKIDKKVKKRRQYLQQLKEDQFELISGWHHWAILSLLETKDFKSSPIWISDRLGLELSDVESALNRLKKLGLILQTKDGTLTATQEGLKTSEDVMSRAIQQSHISDMKLASTTLNSTLPIAMRDFSSCTLAVNIKNIPKLKKHIRAFYDKVSHMLEDDHASEVYRLSVYFYPLTKISEN